MIRLLLARHGETAENVARVLQGHMPGHLTEVGKEQARALREELLQRHEHPDALLVSDLRRTMDTAGIVNEAFCLPLTPCVLLRERDWGSLTGYCLNKGRISDFPADVESVDDMFCRARTFLTLLGEKYDGKCVLSIGHGLFNRVIQAAWRGVSIADVPPMKNAEVRELCLDPSALHQPEAHRNGMDMLSDR